MTSSLQHTPSEEAPAPTATGGALPHAPLPTPGAQVPAKSVVQQLASTGDREGKGGANHVPPGVQPWDQAQQQTGVPVPFPQGNSPGFVVVPMAGDGSGHAVLQQPQGVAMMGGAATGGAIRLAALPQTAMQGGIVGAGAPQGTSSYRLLPGGMVFVPHSQMPGVQGGHAVVCMPPPATIPGQESVVQATSAGAEGNVPCETKGVMPTCAGQLQNQAELLAVQVLAAKSPGAPAVTCEGTPVDVGMPSADGAAGDVDTRPLGARCAA